MVLIILASLDKTAKNNNIPRFTIMLQRRNTRHSGPGGGHKLHKPRPSAAFFSLKGIAVLMGLLLLGPAFSTGTFSTERAGSLEWSNTERPAPVTNDLPMAKGTVITETISQTGSGNFTVPAGVASITVEVWGGGGGGSDPVGNDAGGGGGGAAYARRTFSGLSSGTSFNLFVATGGAAGGTGEDSWFVSSTTLMAKGGQGGGPGGPGGTGGSATNSYGDNTFSGGDGGDGRTGGPPPQRIGGGGGGSATGTSDGGNGQSGQQGGNGGSGEATGGDGGSGSTNGSEGGTPGAGGGGASSSSGGGRGGDGRIIITYTLPEPDPASSTITPEDPTVTADGSSNTVVTLQVRYPNGDPVSSGGDAVTLSTDAGSLGNVSDNGDGTYSAVLTASTNVETATISGTLNGDPLTETATVDFLAGAPETLVFESQPTNAAAGAQLNPPVEIHILDAFDNLVTDATTLVTVSIDNNAGSGTLDGQLSVSATGGVATFNNLSIDKTGEGYTLEASASSLAPDISASFNITPGTPAQLSFEQSPTNTEPGEVLTPPVTIRIEDNLGNLVTTATDNISIAIDNNPSGGSLSGTQSRDAVDGIATFDDLSIDTPGDGYTLEATSGGLTPVTSTPFDIQTGAPVKLSFVDQPSNTEAGEDINPPVTVHILDDSDNLVSDASNTITISIEDDPAGGTLGGQLSTTASGGIATFDQLSINKAGDGYTLRASASSLSADVSGAFNITPAAPAQLVFDGQPSNSVAGESISPEVTVNVLDTYNNLVTDADNNITLAIDNNPGQTTLQGTTTVAATDGTATLSDLYIEIAATDYTLQATATGLSSDNSSSFRISPAAASGSETEITANPSVINADGSSTSTIEVRARDAYGNPLTSGGATVSLNTTLGSLSGVSDQGNGTYQATLTAPESSGESDITGSINGETIGDPATVFFRDVAGQEEEVFDANGTFTVPDGVTEITVHAWGAGGGGGTNEGGGGGGGAFAKQTLGGLTSGTSYNVTVGNGGNAGTDGGDSYFDNTGVLRADGGSGGGNPGGGAGGQGGTGEQTYSGGNGADGVDGGPGGRRGGGGGGSATETGSGSSGSGASGGSGQGAGGDGGTNDSAAQDGESPGGGGGGGYTNETGGSGANGRVVVTWDIPEPDPATSTIESADNEIPADGSSQTTITISLNYANGDPVNSGGDIVLLETTAGTLGSVTDNDDGTYTASLTASTNAETAVVTGAVNGLSMTDEASVVFAALPEPAGITLSGPVSVDAGETSGNFTLTVVDSEGNPTGVRENTTFSLSSSQPSTASFSPGSSITMADGENTASFTYSNTQGGIHQITAARESGDPALAGSSGSHDIQVLLDIDPNTFSLYRKYETDHNQVDGSSALTDFPVLFSKTHDDFRHTSNGGHITNNNGYDIIFTAGDGSTTLDHDLEYYDPVAGTIIAWVRIPSLSATSNTPFFLYYGNDQISNDLSVNTTWDDHYKLVMHMAGNLSDASTANNQASNNGSSSLPGGQVNGARSFSPGDFIQVEDSDMLTFTDELSISLWIKPSNVSAGPDLVSKGSTHESYSSYLDGGNFVFSIDGNSYSSSQQLTDNQWSYLTMTRDPSGWSIYIDGNEDASGGTTPNIPAVSDDLFISSSSASYEGVMDEVRISGTARSAEWVKTKYNNQSNPESFITEALLPPDPGQSTIEADPAEITADGISTANITLQARNVFGEDLTGGGASVSFATTAGTISSATDQGDGTYTAQLTASTAQESAMVTGIINEETVQDDASVAFKAGPPAKFSFAQAPATVNLSAPADFVLKVLDANDNPTTDHSGFADVISVSNDAGELNPSAVNIPAGDDEVSFSWTHDNEGLYTIEASGSGLDPAIHDIEIVDDFKLGMLLWLKGDEGTYQDTGGNTPASSQGEAIREWHDQSGNNRVFSTSGTPPTLETGATALNNRPAIRFAGTGDELVDEDGDSYINGLNEFTIFFVIKSDRTDTDRGFWHTKDPDDLDDIFTIRYDQAGFFADPAPVNNVKLGILDNDQQNQIESYSDVQVTDGQIVMVHWKSGEAYDLFVDGIVNNPSLLYDPPTGSLFGATKALIGKSSKDDNNNSSWDGLIGEVILYDRLLSRQEREQTEDYLSEKYGISIRRLTPARGGEAISADDAGGDFTTLTGPIIKEGFRGELVDGETIQLRAPAGFEWDTGGTDPQAAISPVYGGITDLQVSFTSRDSKYVTFTVAQASNASSGSRIGQVNFSGLRIRPSTTEVPNEGNIRNTGSTGQAGSTNYGSLTMVPGAADKLIFTSQPSSTTINQTISPAVGLQLVDQYSNYVETDNVDVSISLSEGSGSLQGTLTQTTNSSGQVSFDDLSVDDTGDKKLTANATNITAAESELFNIVLDGQFTAFLIEKSSGGNITSKSAGEQFDLTISAVDGNGIVDTEFNGQAVITSNGTLGTGGGTTANFVNGVLASHTVSVISTGNTNITATYSQGSESGTSNNFQVSPGTPSAEMSTISANPTVIINDGQSTSDITVQLKDAYENNILTGGSTVILSTTAGSLSGITDNGDGTYSAVLTSPTAQTTTTISGTLNGTPMDDTAQVMFAEFDYVWQGTLGDDPTADQWEHGPNWNTGTVPEAESAVLIPSNPSVGNKFPVVSITDTEARRIMIESDASLSLSGGINMIVHEYINGNGMLEGSNQDTLSIGGDLDIGGITLGTVIFNGNTSQSIINPHTYTNLGVDNPGTVKATNNLIVEEELNLIDGILRIPNNRALIANDKNIAGGQLQFVRVISGPKGWRMLGSPVASTYDDLLDGTLTQGYTNSTLGTSNEGEALQPNVFWYDETFPGTDNQRWRAPDNATANLTAGRGLYLYVFGDVAEDPRYNEPLPDTLIVTGQEFEGDGIEFDFDITYTLEADTGWNFVSNPFGASLNWDSPGWTKTNIDNTIYIWNPSANGGNGEFLTWNGNSGSLGSGLIRPFQGFWVKANDANPVLKVSKSAKTTGGTFLQKDGIYNPDQWVTHLEGDTNESFATSPHVTTKNWDSTEWTKAAQHSNPRIIFRARAGGMDAYKTITFREEALRDKDRYDGYRLLPLSDSFVELFSTLPDGSELVVNNLPENFEDRMYIPIHVGGYKNQVLITDPYTISWPALRQIPDDWVLTLVDHQTGERINIREQQAYNFNLVDTRDKGFYPANIPGSSDYRLKNQNNEEPRFTLIISDQEIEATIPEGIFLEQNHPNPFSGTTTIRYGLAEEDELRVEVYNVMGQRVDVLANGKHQAGFYEANWKADGLDSGIYICILRTSEDVKTIKMTLMR
ncbi:MAG: DUF2341 domain-containing protein [Bacteroidales bacterium]